MGRRWLSTRAPFVGFLRGEIAAHRQIPTSDGRNGKKNIALFLVSDAFGDMAEQVDAGDLKSPDFGRVGSTPSIPTTLSKGEI